MKNSASKLLLFFVLAIFADGTRAASSAAAEKASSKKRLPKTVAQQVDQLLAKELHETHDTGALGSPASDAVFLRRVYLDLIGRNPTPDEITVFALDKSQDKQAKLVDRLLDNPQFGENWGRYWRDVIFYRRSDDRALIASPATEKYLQVKFNENAPWDEIARSFITATGDVREQGETGLIMAQAADASNVTAEVSRIFLGIQIQCAQCHDHNTDRWKRTQFHELAAFFPRMRIQGVNTADKRTFIVASRDPDPVFRFAANRRPAARGEHFMPDLENPQARGTRMDPVFFLNGKKLSPGKTDAERRAAIAQWFTESEWFAKAYVNRIWAELVGEGFYESIDDIGPDRQATAPESIDCLATAFAGSGYDVKWLYRTITATDAYRRESRSRRNPSEMPFANNCPQRLRGDQLFNALSGALGIRDRAVRGGARNGQQRSIRFQFDQVFGFDPSNPRDEMSGSIPQTLLLMNSPILNREINGSRRDTNLGKLLASTTDNEAVAVELYLMCLGREPNSKELATCLAHVKRTANRTEAFEDVLWALINSNEFSYRK